MVKLKTGNLKIFSGHRQRGLVWILPLLALLTFISSWAAAYPAAAVEQWYARALFPQVSRVAGQVADLVAFPWLDVMIPLAGLLLIVLLWKKRWAWLANVAAMLYLLFFWTWGLNYHRQPLNSKLQLDSARMQPDAMTEFARHAAAELNRLYGANQAQTNQDEDMPAEAGRRVRRVIAIIDGSDWESADRIKTAWITGPWLRAAGIDGVFNPLCHEPVISSTILDVEWPFVVAHELAHVRGYPNEGDANVIATFATLMSEDPSFQYSGWLNLWLYLRTRDLEKLLDSGPRRDIQRIFERARKEQIVWINDFQRALLDWFLKANSVDEGVRSYSQAVLIAAGSQPVWERFR